MRKPWLLAAVLTLALSLAGGIGAAHGAEAERPVSGLVNQVHSHARTLYVGPMKFYVPAKVYDLDELSEGARVVISFKRSGGQLHATSIELDTEAD